MNLMQSPHEKLHPYVDKLVTHGWRVMVQNQDAILLEGFPVYTWGIFVACAASSILGIFGLLISLVVILGFIKHETLRLHLDDYGDIRIKTLSSTRIDTKLARPSQLSYFYAVQSRKPYMLFCIVISSLVTIFWAAMIVTQ